MAAVILPRYTAGAGNQPKNTMGRPSKLTDKQWDEIEQRMLNGEGSSKLAREFGVTEGAVRRRKNTTVNTVKAVANQLVAAERAVQALPVSTRTAARNYAAKLLALGDVAYDAASMGIATAYRLHAVANAACQKIDDADPFTEKGVELLKGIAVATRTANEAATLPLAILTANKDRVIRETDAGDVVENEPTNIASIPVLDAAKAYQDFISG